MDVHTGWLHKKSGGKEGQEASKKKSLGQVRNKWDRRYFVIIPSGAGEGHGGTMMYFKSDADWDSRSKPKGVVNLQDAELLLPGGEQGQGQGSGGGGGGGGSSSLEFAVRCTRPPSHQGALGMGSSASLAFPPRVYVFRAESASELARHVAVLRRVITKVQEGVDGAKLARRRGGASEIRYTHGFGATAGEHGEYSKQYRGLVAKQQKRWYSWCREQRRRPEVRDARQPELALERPPRALCRGGIPPELRGQMWPLLSGAAARVAAQPEHYAACQRMADSALPTHVSEQIEKDLPRTFSDNPVLARRTEALRRLLRAYASHDPVVGYCQSLNFLAAILLLYMAEELAFWVLAHAVQTLLPQGYYEHGMRGLRTDHKVLSRLVELRLPGLGAHLSVSTSTSTSTSMSMSMSMSKRLFV
jgi:hypothetical protein